MLFFLVCKKITFSTFPQQAIFFLFWGRGGEGGSITDFPLLCCLLVLFYVCHFSLGGGLRLVALFDSRPSRFT